MQVWNDGGQVGVTRSLAQAIEGALHVTSTALHGGQRVGNCATRVVMTMDADRCVVTNVLLHCCNNVEHFVRKRSAIRVAKHQVRCAVDDCGLKCSKRKLGVGFVAVEEVLHVYKHSSAVAVQKLDRVGDHGNALFKRCLQCLRDVVVPRFCHDAHGRSLGVEQVAKRCVVVNFSKWSARRTECNQR